MTSPAKIYFAVHVDDLPIADVILAHMRHLGYICLDCTDVQHMMNFAKDMQATISECDTLVLIDSHAFRRQKPNYELQYAQQLEKPLIVMSLDKKVNEALSNRRVRLFDFSNPQHRNWQGVVDAIVELTETVRHEDNFGILFQ